MFRIEIETGNDAFQALPGAEIADMLEGLAARLRSDDRMGGVLSIQDGGTLKDVNGGTCGSWQYFDDNDNESPEEGPDCGQPWVAEIGRCPRCNKAAADHRAWRTKD